MLSKLCLQRVARRVTTPFRVGSSLLSRAWLRQETPILPTRLHDEPICGSVNFAGFG
jgi:hypothetical protein